MMATMTDPRIHAIKIAHQESFVATGQALDLEESGGSSSMALKLYKKALGQINDGLSLKCTGPEFVGVEWDKIRTLQSKMDGTRQMIRDRIDKLEADELVHTASRELNAPSAGREHRVLSGGVPGHRPPAPSAGCGANRSRSGGTAPGRPPPARSPSSKIDTSSEQYKKLKQLDPKIRDAILNEVVQDCAKVSMSDIIGLEGAKKALNEIVVMPALRPELFTGLRRPARGLLLFGPPGNGKTMLAKAIANEARCTFFNISASSLTSKWVGESEKLVRALFVSARVMQPSIIFIDEIDSILSKRGDGEAEASRRLKTEVLVQFDGVGGSAEDRVLVMGATNLPQEIDEAGLRRFTKRIYIPMPDEHGRSALVQQLLRSEKHTLSRSDMTYISRATAGYSNSDLTALTSDAAYGPLRELGDRIRDIKQEKVRGINVSDFKDALINVRPSTSVDSLQFFEEWNKAHGTMA